MLNPQTEIADYLKQLHMPGIRNSYEKTAEQARKESWSYEQYLLPKLSDSYKKKSPILRVICYNPC
jgi:hypothetical protein